MSHFPPGVLKMADYDTAAVIRRFEFFFSWRIYCPPIHRGAENCGAAMF